MIKDKRMVICPIARTVHCTGCPFVKFCPAKTLLGDFGKIAQSTAGITDDEIESSEEEPTQQSEQSVN